mgnify:CR=1 FL=1
MNQQQSPALTKLKSSVREITFPYAQVFCRECEWLILDGKGLAASLVAARTHTKRTGHNTTVRQILATTFLLEETLTP